MSTFGGTAQSGSPAESADLQLAPTGQAGPDFGALREGDWKDIRGHDGYQIHPSGRVRSCWRMGGDVRRYGFQKTTEWHELKCRQNPRIGYIMVGLGRGKMVYLHRLLAEAFLPNPEGKRTVNHKNGVRSDNRLENLEWATWSENHIHRCRVLERGRGDTSGTARLTTDDVLNIITLRGQGARPSDLAEAYSVARTTISHILHGRTWTHLTEAA